MKRNPRNKLHLDKITIRTLSEFEKLSVVGGYITGPTWDGKSCGVSCGGSCLDCPP